MSAPFQFPEGITLDDCLFCLVEAKSTTRMSPDSLEKYLNDDKTYDLARRNPNYVWFGWRDMGIAGYLMSDWSHEPITLTRALRTLPYQPKYGALYRKLL